MATPVSESARLAELTAKLLHANQELATAHAELRTTRSDLDGARQALTAAHARTRELELRVQQLEQTNRELEREQRMRSSRALEADDLKRIRGIGPAFERALRAQGVSSIAEIAAWTDADLTKFAERLKIRPERIRRDDWVGSAQALLRAPE